jgi:hypothetical protein
MQRDQSSAAVLGRGIEHHVPGQVGDLPGLTRMSFIAAQFKFRVIGKIRCKFQRVDVARSATGLEQLTNVLPPKTVV